MGNFTHRPLLFLLFACCSIFFVMQDITAAERPGSLEGFLHYPNGEIFSGTVALFDQRGGPLPADNIRRVPDRLLMTDRNGFFRVQLSSGTYFLGALPGPFKNHPGPPEGNMRFPLASTDGEKISEFHVAPGQIREVSETVLLPLATPPPTALFRIKGTVRSKEDTPLAEVYIIAKRRFEDVRPLYISSKTDSSGTYALFLPAGSYVLVARHKLDAVGRPGIGDLFGVYGVDKAAGVYGNFEGLDRDGIFLTGTAGEVLTDVDIRMLPIPDPEKQKKKLRDEKR